MPVRPLRAGPAPVNLTTLNPKEKVLADVKTDGSAPESARLARLEERVDALERALMHLMQTATPDADRTQPLQVITGAAAQPTGNDALIKRLEITNSFASLDAALAEAQAAEARLAQPFVLNDAVEIDATLIDKAFARPPPELLDVISWLEETHPKITERIVLSWRTPELLVYLKRLIVDDRGDRAGFIPGVMSELLLLSAVLESPPEARNWNAVDTHKD